MNQYWGVDADPTAQGRIKGGRPVAVLDIGSNSVRLVVYERHARALTPLYNEKSACALGRGLAATGRLAYENIDRALTAIQRFALVTRLMKVGQVHILATSAVRDASNSKAFVTAVEEVMGAPVRVLSGEEEAHYAALGVLAGIPDFTGVVGDLGGGSLELSAMTGGRDTVGETHELGVIRMQDDAGGSAVKARGIAQARLLDSKLLARDDADTFCAIGGTWRSLAKVHQVLRGYPLHMVQHYVADAGDLASLCDEIVEAVGASKSWPGSDAVSSGRRDLVPYGAAVLGEVLRAGKFEQVVFSALGVRGLSPLAPRRRRAGGRSAASGCRGDVSPAFPFTRPRDRPHRLHQRSHRRAEYRRVGGRRAAAESGVLPVRHRLAGASGLSRRTERRSRRLWVADRRRSPGPGFLAEVLAVRYMGLKHKSVSAGLLNLAGDTRNVRARLIGAAFRVAYPMSAAMPGVLPRTGFSVQDGVLTLDLPSDLAFLDGEHLRGRMEQLAAVAGYKALAIRA